ncbi:ester cyclase [Larkinella rosea]|uniref:Ester cyclase n=1 Tax=Larkinella rosea TaxID=2025312 RepID=A0A3P1BNM8_9BACT|nr:ester cyclase [Larkinella rosea]RRB02671.1 ester cyclase [Larkinella rosea]
METTPEQNKKTIVRFNREFIEQGKIETFNELVADDVFNHSAAPGASTGADGMFHFLQTVLKGGFPDLTVEIFDQIGEADKVTTRKAFYGTHTGEFLGIPPTHKKMTLQVIEIVRLKDGKYAEHWGLSNLPAVLAELAAQ